MKTKLVALCTISAVIAALVFSFQNATIAPSDTLSHYDARCSTKFVDADGTKIYNAIVAAGLSPEEALSHAMNRLGYGVHSASTYTQAYITKYKTTYGTAEARKRVAAIVLAALRRGSLMNANAATILRNQFPLLRKNDSQIFQELAKLYKARDDAKEAGNTALAVELEMKITLWRKEAQVLLESKHYVAALMTPDVAVGEVLTDFWFNHFSINSNKTDTATFEYENIIRANICGSFKEILSSTAHSVGMIRFLDNFMSVGRGVHWSGSTGLNENYARELLELHTLGVGPLAGVYTQGDIRETARVLTGWGFATEPYPQRLYQEFKFNEAIHATGTKTVMNRSYVQGQVGGETLLNNLSVHAYTKRNICLKLGKRLLSKAPSAALYANCVATWGSTGDFPRLYMSFLENAEFWKDINSKVKNPFEVLASAQRLAGVGSAQLTAANIRKDVTAFGRFGLMMKGNGAPTGYSENHLDWLVSGYINNLVTTLFKNLNINLSVSVVNGNSVDEYTGAAMENHVRSLASKNPTTTLTTIKTQIVEGAHLSFVNTNGNETLLDGLLTPDRSGSTTLPVRTTTTLMTSSKNFLLK